MTSEEQQRLLRRAVLEIGRRQKSQNLLYWGSEAPCAQTQVIPTGSLGLDLALGVGGWPRGRICEIVGAESAGKTTLALHAVCQAQRQGLAVLFVDAEHAFDRDYAAALGVDLEQLLVCKPQHGTQALDVVQDLVQTGALGLCVVDSVSALTPRAEAEGDISDQEVGGQARLMSKALRILTPLLSQTGCTLLFLNQIRYKVGVLFGNPETTSGGNALRFYASCRVQLSRHLSKDIVDEDKQRIGNRVAATVVKNKLAAPFRKAEFDILYGRGIHRCMELLQLGVQYEVISQPGAGHYVLAGRSVRGKAAALGLLEQDPKLQEEIEAGIRARHQEYLAQHQSSLLPVPDTLALVAEEQE